jgi:hypothetical protein
MRKFPMSADPVSVSPEEVRAVARFPLRWCFALAAALALGLGAHQLASEPPPPSPAAQGFQVSDCMVEPDTLVCLGALPAELRSLPSRERYLSELVFPLLHREDRPSWTSAAQFDEELARAWVEERLRALAPWLDAPDPAQTRQALHTLAQAGPAPAPRDLWASEDLDLLRVALEVGERFADEYERARRRELLSAWEQAWLAQQLEDDARRRLYHDALGRHLDRQRLGVVLLGMAALSALAWMGLGPLHIRAGLHHLDWAGDRLAWTDLIRLAWAEGQVNTRTSSHSLWPRRLSPEAVEALSQASARALERARAAAPMDREALA